MKKIIITFVILLAVLAGVFYLKSQNGTVATNPNPPQSPTPTQSPAITPIQNDSDLVWGKITSLSQEKMVIVDERGNSIDIPLSTTVKYYDKQMAGTVVQKEINFSSFHVGEWVAVRGTSYRESESKPIYRLVPGSVEKSQDPNTTSR